MSLTEGVLLSLLTKKSNQVLEIAPNIKTKDEKYDGILSKLYSNDIIKNLVLNYLQANCSDVRFFKIHPGGASNGLQTSVDVSCFEQTYGSMYADIDWRAYFRGEI